MNDKMKAKVNYSQKLLSLTILTLSLSVTYGDIYNQITAVSPNSAIQGALNQTITITLDTDNPPAPPVQTSPQSVTIGGLSATSVSHTDQYTVTAVFDFLPAESAGLKDVAVSFKTPNNTLVFSMTNGFTIVKADNVPPSITAQPQSQTIASGNPVTFAVTAWGTEPLSYQWYKDCIRISGANDSSFTIDSVAQSDEGDYLCIITNDFGSVISDTASLSIAVAVNMEPPFEGYNLFCPMRSGDTYLMDNNGQIIHTWSSPYSVGNAVYLLEDGTLLRTANTRDTAFDAGGAGGRVERYSWDNNLLWSFDYSSTEYKLHHDIEMMPNGNILMIAWELKTEAEVLAAGRNPSLLTEGELWPDCIIEVEPAGSSGGDVVWKWNVWDHLIQDYDATKEHYGVVADHTEKINLNYAMNGKADWNHTNSIDYNAELDQIMVSVHNFSEIWIIDHNTTTAEAAGIAGDILYRWGNPQAYDMGTSDDQQFFVQHDAEWIESGCPGEGDILVFNNGRGRSTGNYSSVDQITPPLNPDGSYTLQVGLAYGPNEPAWTYTSTPVTDFYAEQISGSQRLANGNTLICEGTKSRLFEVTSDGTIVWEYDYDGEIFRVERYSPYYSGFVGTELEPELPESGYPIVDTGQDKCYDNSSQVACPAKGEAFYGQDAQCNGNQSSYTLSADGLTVTDNVTGLTWTQSPDLDNDGDVDVDDKLLVTEALAYPDVINAQNFGGYDDWRLPTIKELYSLIMFYGAEPNPNATSLGNAVPFIDTNYFDFGYGDLSAGERLIDGQYASSTIYVSTTMGGNETMFGLNLADGRIKGYPTGKTFYVYFVRGNKDYGVNSFVDNGDGTISDLATGLMWAHNDSGVGLNWQEALGWVQTKNAENYLGYNDWRLPNAKELHSIVDYTRSPSTTGSAAIAPLFNCTQITNEAGEPDYPFYWTSTTHSSQTPERGTTAVYISFGRAMGYMERSGWIDVHGAGAQRSDSKSGNPADWPTGHGPQGDAIRIYNYVRLVRDVR